MGLCQQAYPVRCFRKGGCQARSRQCRPGQEESHIPQIPEDAAGVRPWCLAESSTVLLGRDVMWLEKYRVGC